MQFGGVFIHFGYKPGTNRVFKYHLSSRLSPHTIRYDN